MSVPNNSDIQPLPPDHPSTIDAYVPSSAGRLRVAMMREVMEAREHMVAIALFSPNHRTLWQQSEQEGHGMYAALDLPALKLNVPQVTAIVAGLVAAAGYSPVHMKAVPVKDDTGQATTKLYITNPDFDPARVWDAFEQAQQLKKVTQEQHGAAR